MTQLELPKAQEHSETSKDAARNIESKAATLRKLVHLFLLGKGEVGATDEEMQHALDMQGSTQRPRRIELCERGLVIDSGRTQETRSGRRATIWVVLP
jgi:hypothetical protein